MAGGGNEAKPSVQIIWFAGMLGQLIYLGAAIPYYAGQPQVFSAEARVWLYSLSSALVACGTVIVTRMVARTLAELQAYEADLQSDKR